MSNDFPLVSASGKKYRLETGADGHEVRVYESGTVWDNQTKRLLSSPKKHLITSDNARELAFRKHEKARKAFEDGAIEVVNGKSPADAQKVLGRALMKRAIDPEASNAVQATEKIAEFAHWIPGKRDEGESLPPGSIRLTLTGSIAEVRRATGLRYHPEDAAREDVTPKDEDSAPLVEMSPIGDKTGES